VIGTDGVSLTDGPISLTVRYDDCAGALSYADGGWLLFARDAVAVSIEPQLWVLPAAALAILDRRLPADRVARMPARPDDQIPKPPPATVTPPAEVRRGLVRNVLIYAAVVLLWLAVPAVLYLAISGGHSPLAAVGVGVIAYTGGKRLLTLRRG
jgi:hypothetical protein